MNDSLLLTCRAIQALAEPFRIIIHLVLACVTGACVKDRPSSHDMVVCSMLRTWIARRTWRQTIERYQLSGVPKCALGSGAIPNVPVSRVTKAGRSFSRRSRVRRALRAKCSAEDIRVVACQPGQASSTHAADAPAQVHIVNACRRRSASLHMCVALSSHMMDSLLLTCRAFQATADAFRIIIHLVLACGTGACVKARP